MMPDGWVSAANIDLKYGYAAKRPTRSRNCLYACSSHRSESAYDDRYVNPPFSALLKWLRRAHHQWQAGLVETVICLVLVRTDSSWFHGMLSADADIYLLQGRVRFLDSKGNGQHIPFSLKLLTLGATPEQKERYAELVPGFWLTRSRSG